MVFSGLNFLFIFLPIVLVLYYICPAKMKNFMLMIASLVFYAWGEPVYVLIMIGATVFGYLIGRLIQKFKNMERKKMALGALIASVVVNLSVLGLYKYAGPHIGLALPIGISFFTFQIMSYTIDVYRGKVACQKNLIDFGTYVTMFPQLIAGPIVRYETVEKQLKTRELTTQKFADGIRRFVIGLGKKVLIANMCGTLWEYSLAMPAGERVAIVAWLGALGFTFQIYFDFSGYSDMAIGLGKMFGFEYEENFNYPYIGKSITEFWNRWHISLSSWFKEYVYIPLGGNKKGLPRQILNIMIVWGLTGIWHGASINFLLWGLYFGILLIIEKIVKPHIKFKIPVVLGHIYMMLLVIGGWVLFAIEDFSVLAEYLGSMFGVAGIWNLDCGYIVAKYSLLLIIAIIGSTPLPKKAALWLKDKLPTPLRVIVFNLFIVLVLLISVGLIVGDTYNPFLYFRF